MCILKWVLVCKVTKLIMLALRIGSPVIINSYKVSAGGVIGSRA